ncbi:MAG: hypothetical protein ACRDE9_05720 [Candidatus Limnocylindria bacterium]
MRGRSLATLTSLLLLAACAPSASETPSPSPLATPGESISEVPSPAACDPGVVCDGPLAAGDYASDTTGAHIEFTLDAHDWSGLADTPGDGFALFLADVGGGHGISVVSFSGEIFTDPCSPDATSVIGTTPSDFMGFLVGRGPYVIGGGATDPSVFATQVEVSGRPALQADITTSIDDACAAAGGDRIWLWTLPVHGDFHFNDQETARVIAVDGGSATVIIVIEAFPEADYDHLLDHAMEVVETMVITPL